MHRPWIALAAAVLLLSPTTTLSAQQIDRTVAGFAPRALPETRAQSLLAAPTPQDTAGTRRPIGPYLLVGALIGGVVGAVLEADFHDDFCSPGPGVSCSSDYNGIGIVIGAGLGMLGGWIIYAISEPPARPPPSPSARRPR